MVGPRSNVPVPYVRLSCRTKRRTSGKKAGRTRRRRLWPRGRPPWYTSEHGREPDGPSRGRQPPRGAGMEELWRRLEQNAEVYVGRLIGAIIILIVGILAVRYLLAPLRRILERGRMESSAASFVTNTARAVLIIAIGIAMLQQLGMQTASLVTVLAAGGLAVALSLQNTLPNFAAGLLLLFFRMVRVGDLIEAGGMRGRVTEILPFHVVLLGDDNEVLTLPNSVLTGTGFRNLSAQPARRAQWTLPLRPGDDLGAAKAA